MMKLVLELVMLVILVKLDLFGFELLLMVLVELVLNPPKKVLLFSLSIQITLTFFPPSTR